MTETHDPQRPEDGQPRLEQDVERGEDAGVDGEPEQARADVERDA